MKNIEFLKEKILYFPPNILKNWAYVFSINSVWWSWKTSFIKIVEKEVIYKYKDSQKIKDLLININKLIKNIIEKKSF